MSTSYDAESIKILKSELIELIELGEKISEKIRYLNGRIFSEKMQIFIAFIGFITGVAATFSIKLTGDDFIVPMAKIYGNLSYPIFTVATILFSAMAAIWILAKWTSILKIKQELELEHQILHKIVAMIYDQKDRIEINFVSKVDLAIYEMRTKRLSAAI
jgi:hypothetical protein